MEATLRHNKAAVVVCNAVQPNEEPMTPIHKLTRAKIRKLTQNGMHSDGGGLFVEVTNGGSGRSWLFKYRLTGTRKQRLMGLGSLNKISLAEARVLAHEYREMVKAGLDPLVEREKNKATVGRRPPRRDGMNLGDVHVAPSTA